MEGVVMKRRDLLALIVAAVAFPLAVHAQQPAKVPKIVWFLMPQPSEYYDAFYQGLASRGYVNGKNITVDIIAPPTTADIPAFAAKAIAAGPQILVTGTAPLTQALKDLTSSVPIVTVGPDLVESGFVASLAHPGGNITGVESAGPEIGGKRVTILKQTVPTLRRIAILFVQGSPVQARFAATSSEAAIALGLEPVAIGFDDGGDIVTQFRRVVAADVQAVVVANYTYFKVNQQALCDLVTGNRLASLLGSTSSPFCGLVAYGPAGPAQYFALGSYIDAILKGAKPGDLPVEYTTVFDFVVNLATAKTLGVTVPASILAQATQVIQ
jgi:ABC-type uncharacterized transport system substrate-binding protein